MGSMLCNATNKTLALHVPFEFCWGFWAAFGMQHHCDNIWSSKLFDTTLGRNASKNTIVAGIIYEAWYHNTEITMIGINYIQ